MAIKQELIDELIASSEGSLIDPCRINIPGLKHMRSRVRSTADLDQLALRFQKELIVSRVGVQLLTDKMAFTERVFRVNHRQ